jgi:putative ABC transport system permease protein
VNGLLQDLRVGWRGLARAPGFTAVVVLVMALGIGVNTMIFGVVNAFLVRSFPFVDMRRHVLVWTAESRTGERFNEVSAPDYRDLRDRAKSFEAMGAWFETMAYVTLGTEPERFDATAITPGILRVFQTRPVLGREFLPEEEEKTRSFGVILLSHRIWAERFGADPEVLGRTIKMNGRVRRIVGVAPPEFRLPEKADFFIPVHHDPAENSRDARFLEVVGLLAPAASRERADAEAAAISADLAREYPESNRSVRLLVTPYRSHIVEDMGPILAVLMAAVGFVLLIACANVANLMLARGAGRQREIALRYALGATRGRVVRQLLTESLIVAGMGGVVGLVLAIWGRDLTLASIPEELPYWMKFDTDLNTLAFLFGVSLLSAGLAGLMPALQTSQVDVHEALKEGGQHGTAGRGRSRLRSGLVVGEIALALVLLAGAGLMIRSFLHQVDQRATVRADHLLTATFTMPVAVYVDDAARLAFTDALVPAIEALPGVEAVSAIQSLPLGRSAWTRTLWLEGDPIGDQAPRRLAFWSIIRPGYFEVVGVPLRAGRGFTPHDGPDAPRVAIVSQTAARLLWPDRDPLGQRFKWSHDDTTGWKTVVGVVADVRQHIESQRPAATVYVPHAQAPLQTMTLLVRHEGDPGTLATAMRRTVQSRDSDMPLYDVRTMDESMRFALWESRIYVGLMSAFAAIALLIAAVGIYGVMAYSVAQRTQEIGIRIALGAARRDVLRLVLGQALRLTTIGLGLGLAGAYAVTRLMASVLFGVSPTDPPTYVGVSVILALSALLAAWVPAERVTRLDPMAALRAE